MNIVPVAATYERNGWPSLPRADLKPPAGWSLSLLTAINRIYNHQLAPDGKRIAFLWNREGLADVYLMPARGGWPVRLTTDRPATPYWWDEVPQWSPDSRLLAFCVRGQIMIASLESGHPRPILEHVKAVEEPRWLPDSRGLVVTVREDGAARLYLTDREGVGLRRLTEGTGDDLDARPAPDGAWVAYTHRPTDDLNRLELRIVELESGQIRTLSGSPGQKDWSPRWSPDGTCLAFLSQRSGFNEVWLIRPDGEGMRQLTHRSQDVADLAWSPDGTQLACTVNNHGKIQLARIFIDGGETQILRADPGYYSRPQWSPVGNSLYVLYEDPLHPPDIYRISLQGARRRRLTDSQPAALPSLRMTVPETVSYRSSDGLDIAGMLFTPRRPNNAALVYPHGGPADQYIYSWDFFIQYLVAKGYTCLAPNYRGSTGYGVAFEHANHSDWGGGDVQDCLHAAQYLQTFPDINAQKVGMYGGSYGGYLTYCCLARDPQYRLMAGVSEYGDANLLTSWGQCNRSTRLYTEAQLGHPSAAISVYQAGSPIHQVESVRKPLLILHGLEDDVVAPQASQEWVEALRKAGKTYEYKTYPSEPHGFQTTNTLQDVYARVERFFDWHLMPNGPTD